MRAAKPATCGQAIDVPSLRPVSLLGSVDNTSTPGATTSSLSPV